MAGPPAMNAANTPTPRQKLVELHSALVTLRDELQHIQSALQEHAIRIGHPSALQARDEAERLLQRLRG